MPAAYGYVLFSSRDESEFLYYGVSTAPRDRFMQHLREARAISLGEAVPNPWKARTILREKNEGYEISFRVLFQYASEVDAYSDEDYWIKFLRRSGHRLTNLASGGVGGVSKTEASRVVYGARMRAWHADPENKERLKRTQRTANSDPEVREARSAAQKRRYARQEERDANSVRAARLYEDKDYAARQKEIHSDPEVLERIRNSNKRVYEENPEKRTEASTHAKRGWANLSPEQHAERVLKSKLGKRFSAAKKSGWVFELTPVCLHGGQE